MEWNNTRELMERNQREAMETIDLITGYGIWHDGPFGSKFTRYNDMHIIVNADGTITNVALVRREE